MTPPRLIAATFGSTAYVICPMRALLPHHTIAHDGAVLPRRRPSARRQQPRMGVARRSAGADARIVVVGAAVGMAVIEVVAVFVEAPYAAVLAALLLGGAVWLWLRRDSIWPLAFLSILFLFELLYLADYSWNDGTDRLMIIATVVVSGLGLASSVVAYLQRRRSSAST